MQQGADQIILIDNGSSDESVQIALETSPKVKCLSRPQPWMQRRHYLAALRRYGILRLYEWLLIADLDEFWFVRNGESLASYLRNVSPGFHLIYVNWTIFGSSGHETQPESLRRHFVMRQERLGAHEVRKWVCRTRALRRGARLSVHNVNKICSSKVIYDNDNLKINHYMIQSREYFENTKMTRGDVMVPRLNDSRTWAYFENIDRACTVEDHDIIEAVLDKKTSG